MTAVPEPAAGDPGAGWVDYLAAQSDRGARMLLRRALDRYGDAHPGGRLAVDAGSGAGADSVELLRRGWRVLAIDREPAAIALLDRQVPAADRPRLTTLTADFTDVEFPAADLVHCGWSLPHCPADRFPRLWLQLRAALRPGGRFVGQLLGERDDWSGGPMSTAVSAAALPGLLAGLAVETCEEVERDGDAFGGRKHWHYYDIIARHPGGAR